MTEDRERQRKARDVGRDSPGSEEAKQQGMSGERGAQEAKIEGTQRQPPQGSNRSPAARFQQPEEERKHFAPGQATSEQGEKGHPSPDVIRKNQQGAQPRSGSHSAGEERVEEEAQRGEPGGEHTREGRQSAGETRPGHRAEG
jgi:hypothetical protein